MVLIANPPTTTEFAKKNSIELIADTVDIPINTLVYKTAAESIKAADSSAKISSRVIGITAEAISAGVRGTVQTSGEFENALWAFTATANTRLYLEEGSSDLSETSPPTAGQFENSPAYILSATKVFIDPKTDLATEVLAS